MAEFRDSIEIGAPPEAVFEYLTTREGITAWMGQYADPDPTPGGRFAVDIAGYPVRGEYLRVERPHLVVVSWGFAGSGVLAPGASRVEFRLTAIEGGTRVDLRHCDLPETQLRGHADGWANFLPRLAIAGAGDDPGPDRWQPLADRDEHTAAHRRPQQAEERHMSHSPETSTAYEVVRRYHRAWTGGDIEGAMSCVDDAITCRAPGIDLEGKEAYREFIGGFAPRLTGVGEIAGFTDGQRVALFYYPQTAVTSTAPAAELFTVTNGLITQSVLIFDRLSYAPPQQR
ncbi:SRPBCC domain-containing protein [Actinomyces capricornis]|uniref:SRPBCC domain-containing protein n=1 Tax=Actinomyces capricornis TaxID=2755559 RepID=UPI001CC448A1|nr:SRPBCC domain-containing protein [Actinomyces capricornis]